ncbi:MAG: hypothetical protein QXS91_01590 [Candidatus Anstonellales archaeon]
MLVEGKAKIYLCKGVFFNPHMRISRSICTSAFQLINSMENNKLHVLDGFTATGARGIRYNIEAGCQVSFLDISEKAIKCCKKNLLLNNIDGQVIKSDFNRFIISEKGSMFNAIELDPFGSPVPYLWPCINTLVKNKYSYLSVNATDLQVLCGVNKNAALKYYGTVLERNYFCHEMAIRTLLKKIAQIAIEHNAGIKPLISFYYRHAIRVIIKIERGNYNAMETLKNIGYADGIGPIWKSAIKDKEFVKNMRKSYDEEANKIIDIIKEELDTLWFYSTEHIAKTYKVKQVKTNDIINALRENGYEATKTHFSTKGFRTNAGIHDILALIKDQGR